MLFAATGLWSVGVGQFVYLAVTGVLALVFTASFVVLGMCAARENCRLISPSCRLRSTGFPRSIALY